MRVGTLGSLVLVGFIAGGCAKHEMGDPFAKAKPAPEMTKLGRLVGHWSGTAEMIEPSVEEMKKYMPDKNLSGTMKGTSKAEWLLDGMVLKQEGWHEMPDGTKGQFLELIVWDPKAKTYRTFWFMDNGDVGVGTMTSSDDGNTYHFKGNNIVGTKSHGKGTMTFVNDREVTWDWSERGAMGSVKMKGTNKKQ